MNAAKYVELDGSHSGDENKRTLQFHVFVS
jgi:hypothetical protein